MVKVYYKILDALESEAMTIHDLSAFLKSNGIATRRYAEFLVERKFLIRFSQEEKSVYTTSPAGKAFAHDLRLMLPGSGHEK